MFKMCLEMLKVLRRFGLRGVMDSIILSMIRDIDGPLGDTLRYEYYKNKFKSIGSNVKIDTSVYIAGCKYISIGDNVHIDKFSILVASSPNLDLSHRILKKVNKEEINVERGELVIGSNIHLCQYTMVFAYGGVKIGDYCSLSAGSRLYSLSSLPYNPFDKSEVVSIIPFSGRSPTIIGKIELEENTWLGLNVIVFPDVKIRKNSFVKTNSVVLNSCGENSFLNGNPAIKVKKRYDYQPEEVTENIHKI